MEDDYPFNCIGNVNGYRSKVLTTRLMGALRGFLPKRLSEHNFWLKFAFSWNAPGASSKLSSMLTQIQSSQHTIIGVETVDGYAFGAFCSSPWQVQDTWFGSEDCFLWRLKHSRQNSDSPDNVIEIYPYTGTDQLIQYCTHHALAVGGGTDWSLTPEGCPYSDEPAGIGFLLDGDLMGGESSSCLTFANPRLGNRLPNGGNEFDIQCLEVWSLTPCSTSQEAQERETFLMHRDADHRASSDF
jgi:hypothetical protein